MADDAAPWLVLAGLGAFHGINPAMGWLFAVALGMHRSSRAVVALALVPIVLGHAAAVGLALVALIAAGALVHASILNPLAGGLLVIWGLYHLWRGHRHRVRFGLTTGMAGLALWSFLMASAHGAGLMLAPLLLEGPIGHSHHADHVSFAGSFGVAMAAVGVHTLAMGATTMVVALAVYAWLGLAVLRRAWFNVDRLWAGALIAAGILLFLL
ncbi:MAG TPA: hypothetical protein VMN43_09685 [Aestuariivirgaceae bacterium]|nr:hypothetical protein [Aestuariivirgaceae bacterium]